ncbi:MAG: hypothetical protein AUJ57_08690 [Zetaproteobacteria bacterium CG1_02_53_45]|nr:MAG: hypothetical protein AUJ57_08690 [Zetaproteobacteria bacterium CG1_02_53_45]
MNNRVLCVDDEQNVLDGYKRNLRKRYDLHAAVGPEEGLKALRTEGPFAVVISDYAMPGMNGVDFLAQARKIAPETIRMMLTGFANMDNTLAAINEGNIFRFLTKPCEPDALARALDEGLEQYRLKRMEKELLEQTLFGSVRVMSQILSLVNPTAFSSTSRIKFYVKHLANELKQTGVWRFELAAMLCQLGCVTLPPETLSRLFSAQPLSPNEMEIFDKHPAIAAELLENIPRLDVISKMIAGQNNNWSKADRELPDDVAILGSQMLHVALDYDRLSLGRPITAAIDIMRQRGNIYHPRILDAMATIEHVERRMEIRTLKVAQVGVFMVSDEEVKTCNGVLLMTAGQEVSKPVLERLRSFSRTVGVVEPIRMRVPL